MMMSLSSEMLFRVCRNLSWRHIEREALLTREQGTWSAWGQSTTVLAAWPSALLACSSPSAAITCTHQTQLYFVFNYFLVPQQRTNLGPGLSLGLRGAGQGPLELLGHADVLHLDPLHHDAPGLRGQVQLSLDLRRDGLGVVFIFTEMSIVFTIFVY